MKRVLFLTLLCSINVINSFDVLKEVEKYLPTNPVILDAGAYDGKSSLELLKKWPHAIIHAFEALPSNFEKLKKNVRDNKAVHTYQVALSDAIGEATFNVSSHEQPGKVGDQSSSLLKPKGHLRQWRDILFKEQITVKTITIDAWAKQEGVDHIDFIWFDLQGMEWQVLNASPEILKTVKAVFTEVNYSELYEGCMLYPKFKKWFEENGFVEIYKHATWGSFGDALFVRAELL